MLKSYKVKVEHVGVAAATSPTDGGGEVWVSLKIMV